MWNFRHSEDEEFRRLLLETNHFFDGMSAIEFAAGCLPVWTRRPIWDRWQLRRQELGSMQLDGPVAERKIAPFCTLSGEARSLGHCILHPPPSFRASNHFSLSVSAVDDGTSAANRHFENCRPSFWGRKVRSCRSFLDEDLRH